MTNLGPAVLASLVFVFILSVWSWTTSAIPASVSAGLHWIMLLAAAIAAVAVYMATQR